MLVTRLNLIENINKTKNHLIYVFIEIIDCVAGNNQSFNCLFLLCLNSPLQLITYHIPLHSQYSFSCSWFDYNAIVRCVIAGDIFWLGQAVRGVQLWSTHAHRFNPSIGSFLFFFCFFVCFSTHCSLDAGASRPCTTIQFASSRLSHLSSSRHTRIVSTS